MVMQKNKLLFFRRRKNPQSSPKTRAAANCKGSMISMACRQEKPSAARKTAYPGRPIISLNVSNRYPRHISSSEAAIKISSKIPAKETDAGKILPYKKKFHAVPASTPQPISTTISSKKIP